MRHWLKYLIGWSVCILYRLSPFHIPNLEPNLSVIMPFSKKLGWFGGALFGILSMVMFDLITGKIGMWTLLTAGAYGLVGALAPIALKRMSYVAYAVVGAVVFDALTGLTMGPLLFAQPFSQALIGQIPFTAMHILGNALFALAVSPLIEKYVIENRKLELGFEPAAVQA